MRILKTMIVEEEIDHLKIIIRDLNRIGIHPLLIATDTIPIKQFLNTEHTQVIPIDLKKLLNKNIDIDKWIKNTLPNNTPILLSVDYFRKILKLAEKSGLENATDFKKMVNPDLASKQVTGDAIFVKVGKVFKKIALTDIEYIYYADRHANIKVGTKHFPIKLPMRELAQNLPEDTFIQIHQSYIVNKSKITQINLTESQIEIDNKWLPIGIKFTKTLKKAISLFL